MIYSPYATKYTHEHQAGKKNPTNEPYVNLIAEERHLRKETWKAKQKEISQ